MRKLKLIMATLALILGWSNASADTEPTASTPSVGNTYYLYNPTTKLFMTTNVNLPFVRPTGSAWKLEAADGHDDGWVTLRLADNDTEGCGYFWGKWWANNPADNSASYSDERVYQLENTSGKNYKLKSYVWGETTAYIYINSGNEGDRSYRLACNSQDQGGLDEGYMTWQFISEEDYATYMSMDYTSYIKNNDFIDGTANWTLDGSGNKQTHGNTAIEYWKSAAKDGSFDYHQEIVVPAGKYVLRAAMYNSTNGESGASFDPSGQCGVYGTSNGTTKNANVTVDGTAYNIYTTDELLVPDGNLRLGFKNTTTMTARWFGTDWIQLTCIGYCLSGVAIALPDGGAMAADTWYYFDIDVAADNYLATATTLGDIICTDDGSQVTSSATDNITLKATDNSFAAKRYYVKSSSANNLVIEAASYSYNVGNPTLSTADGGYTQSSTFTVTFPDAASNEPGAEPALVASSTATVNGNTVDLSAVTNGFSLDLGSLTAGANYVISIPANVYGYDGESMNSAISLTIHTPEVFDGVYYLYDATNKLFLGRGADYGTRAVADKYGVAMTVATNANGITTFTFVDGSGKLFDANNGNMYTDNSTYPNFAVEATTGGYYVVNKNTTENSTYDYKLYIDGSSNVVASNTNATIWSLLTDTERDAIVDAYPTDNINTVITAAGISTTAVAFESFLSANYEATDKTGLIGTATFTTDGKGSWTWSQVRGQDNQPAYGANFAELWVATGTYSQTVGKANLPAGIYKVTVDGYERRATNDLSNSLGAAGYNLVSSYLAANDEQVRLTDWYTTSKPGNTGGAVTAFNNGEATNELYIYLDGNTDLTIKLAKPNYVWDCWTIFNNFTLTYYSTTVSKTISDAGWATYCSPHALDFSSAIDNLSAAYLVTGGAGGYVTKSQITGTIPANTGILLRGKGEVNIPVVANSDTNVSANKLVGVTANTEIAAEAGYVLMNDATYGVGFYQNVNAFTVGANTAYLSSNFAGGSARSFFSLWDDETTSISEKIKVNSEEFATTPVFNLNGQRIEKPAKGLYIKNGKKVVMK